MPDAFRTSWPCSRSRLDDSPVPSRFKETFTESEI